MYLQLAQQIVEKYSNTNFIKFRPAGASYFERTNGLTAKRDEANSRLSQFCERA